LTHSKINGGDAVENQENIGIRQLPEAEVETCREQKYQQLQIKVK